MSQICSGLCGISKNLSEFRCKITSSGNKSYERKCKKCSTKKTTEIDEIMNLYDALYKICIDCNISKSVTEFKKNSHGYKTYECRCTTCYKIYHDKYYIKNKESILVKSIEYRKHYEKRPETRIKINERMRLRYKNDIEFKILDNIRSRIKSALKSNKKDSKSIEFLGCSMSEFIKWIEYQFNDKMSWNNHGFYWEIDHVIPCASFNMKNIEERHKCFNWSNCRPLEKRENLMKNDKIDIEQINLHKIKFNEYMQHVQIAGSS